MRLNMNRQSLFLPVLVIALAGSFEANAQLRFVNVTNIQSVNANTLHAVTYDGSSNFVAVGANSETLRTASVTNLNSTNSWSPANVSTTDLILKAITFGQAVGSSGAFVASGSNNTVFSSIDNGAHWSSQGKVFANNTVEIDGLAFNGDAYAAVSASLLLARSSDNLTNWHQV